MTINTFPIQTIDAATIVTQIETAKTDTQAARDAALQALADAEQIVEDLTSEPFEISDTAGLQAALDAKASASALATVATSGSYDDLLDAPPAFSGDYDDLTGKPALSAFARTLLAAEDLASIWALLYLGVLAGKNKAAIVDIDTTGTPSGNTVLYGDGNWGPSPVAIANGDPGVARIVDAALSTTVTSAGQDWVAARMIAREHGGIGTLAFAARASGGTNAFGTTIAGSSLTPANAVGATAGSPLTGTWRSLGWAASGGGDAGSTLWQRIA